VTLLFAACGSWANWSILRRILAAVFRGILIKDLIASRLNCTVNITVS
jgi:hypothetical protein